MRNTYIVMAGICGAISFLAFDNWPAFLGWLSAALAYAIAAMERS